MMTYVLLNTVFIALLGLLVLLLRRKLSFKAIVFALILVVALTAVFDPVMIAVGLVEYDATKLLGLYWMGAPVEDFAYAVFAVPFVACIWHLIGDKYDR